MIDKVDFPLTTAQVNDFILEKEYTNFLTLQQAIAELAESGLIRTETVRNRTHLYNTAEGTETLRFFDNRISEAIKEDLTHYFHNHELALRNELSVFSTYYKSTTGEYEIKMTAKDKDTILVDLILSVPDEQLAISMCDQWEKKNQEIYQYLMEQLL